jgi:hypothetical protein
MNFVILLHYLVDLGRRLLRFGGYGAGIMAGAGLMIIAVSTRIGENSPVNNERFLEVVINYALLGAVVGVLVGLVSWLWRQRRER